MGANPTVFIAGAGPVGLTLANELARHGVPIRIVDKAPHRTDKSKALVLWSRTLELFDDAGYVGPFLAAGMRGSGAQISTGKEIVARVSLDSIDSRYPFALMIPQSETERVLEEQLAARGVTVDREVELTGFAEKGDKVEATVRNADGRTETVTADWLIGCDGAHSAVRHGLGFSFEGSTLQSEWSLADGQLLGLEPKDRIHIFWHRDGILAFFPMGDDRWRVIADLGEVKDGNHFADPTLEEMQTLIAHRGSSGITLSNPRWLAAFRINERKVKDYRRGRIFLAGDAAHIHSPAGGQGMNTGMQDAFNLAWKLKMVIAGAARPSLLDSYSIERSAVGDMVLRNAGRLTEAAILRNPIAQGLRNAVVKFATGFPALQHAIADQLAETNIAYPSSPLTAKNGHTANGPKPGMRWPDRLPAGAGGKSFTALGPMEVVTALAQKFPKLVTAVSADDPAHAGALRLIRPDGYVAFVGAADDRAHAEAYLAEVAA
jgi:2-polyprenyl-6-methoxyphenol hydroxylase-like FAD-dependent oxidoreductase